MRGVAGLFMLAAILTVGVAAGGAIALAQDGASIGSSGTGTVGPGTVVTPTSTSTPGGPPIGNPAEQTHPSVRPGTGRSDARFTASLTLVDAPGHSGVLATDYRLQLSIKRKHAAARCVPPTPPNIDSGSANQVVHIPLTAPESGWCVSRYTLTVFLQREPYCPAPTPGQPPQPCPEFATQELDVGHANFLVTPRH